MPNPAPGFSKHPNHTVEIRDAKHPVVVVVEGEEIARSDRAKVLSEASYPDVYYIPLEDIPSALIEESNHSTYCPFKGTASYWDLLAGLNRSENGLWSYKSPYDEMLAIKDHVAFYQSAASVLPA